MSRNVICTFVVIVVFHRAGQKDPRVFKITLLRGLSLRFVASSEPKDVFWYRRKVLLAV